ncbi:MAG: hypothetical protein OSB09_03820 [Planctomycetota bacterium]|nr:hypothetical protein [Planctomycetota bacterium]
MTALLILFGSGAVLLQGSGHSGGVSRGSPAVPAGPQITCDEPLAEWGDLIKGSPFQHVFEIKNPGDQVLIIQKVNGT